MKKALIVALVLGLIAGSLAAPAAAKKKKKKKPPVPVAVDQKFFLRDADGCDTSENQLSLLDGVDTGCWYVDSGLAYEAIVGAGLLTSADLAQSWASVDGTPFALDTSKPITGEVTTSGGACVVDGGCAPAPVSGGLAMLDVTVLATIAGEEKEIGLFTETFPAVPGSPHTSAVEITLDPALEGLRVDSLRVLTYIHGASAGHGIVVLDDPASFLTIPSFK